jgi:hypothetical protein
MPIIVVNVEETQAGQTIDICECQPGEVTAGNTHIHLHPALPNLNSPEFAEWLEAWHAQNPNIMVRGLRATTIIPATPVAPPRKAERVGGSHG